MKYLEKHFSIKFIEKWKKKVFSSKFIITKIVPIENRLQNIDYYYTFLTQQIRKATTIHKSTWDLSVWNVNTFTYRIMYETWNWLVSRKQKKIINKSAAGHFRFHATYLDWSKFCEGYYSCSPKDQRRKKQLFYWNKFNSWQILHFGGIFFYYFIFFRCVNYNCVIWR